MTAPRSLLAALVLCTVSAHAKPPVTAPRPKEPTTVASDDAAQGAYDGGWNESGGGSGFGSWKFQEVHGSSDSYAGHFIADSKNPESTSVASNGKAFGLYANGPEFESASAFRAFSTPLHEGDSFSFQVTNSIIEQKGAKDNEGLGTVGLTLRTGNSADSPDDYNKGARFEIVNLKGQANYQVYDGDENHDTGVVYSEQGINVTVTLTGADTYDLEITRLADHATTKLSRKLGGSGSIESFCIYNRNGEKADGFFNGFKVVSKGK